VARSLGNARTARPTSTTTPIGTTAEFPTPNAPAIAPAPAGAVVPPAVGGGRGWGSFHDEVPDSFAVKGADGPQLMGHHGVVMPDDELTVPDHVRPVLLALAEGWTPAPMALQTVSSLHFAGVELSADEPCVSLERDRLVVTCRPSKATLEELLPLSLGGGTEGALSDGTRVTASSLRRASKSALLTLEFDSWQVLPDPVPAIWVGPVENAIDIAFGGNLVVERVRSGRLRVGHARHFVFSGVYTYYLMQTGSRGDPAWQLVIDAGGGAPDEETLQREFLVLQFAFGRQLRLAALVGIDGGQRTVASVSGAGTRVNLSGESEPPVPIDRNNDDRIRESWTTVLFERIVAVCAARPEAWRPYSMAFDSYLDAMSRHLDADYLRLHVALEAFAYWTLRLANEEERMIVKDKTAWKAWVKGHRSSILEHASAGFGENLYNRVMGVYRLSSGRVVPSVFQAHGLTLTEQMGLELAGRDTVVHQGLMAPEDDEDGLPLDERVAILRTLLVALLAKTAGYSGAINGWEVGNKGYPVEPDLWWSVDQADREMAKAEYWVEE
jgi:hypothetical protein